MDGLAITVDLPVCKATVILMVAQKTETCLREVGSVVKMDEDFHSSEQQIIFTYMYINIFKS